MSMYILFALIPAAIGVRAFSRGKWLWVGTCAVMIICIIYIAILLAR